MNRQQEVHTRTGILDKGVIQSSSGGEVVGSFSFTLDTLEGFASLLATYDAFRVNWIEISYHPISNLIAPSTGAITAWSILASIIDFDGTFPTTVAGFMQRENCVVAGPGQTLVRKFIPAIQMTTAGGAPGAVLKDREWIPVTYDDYIFLGPGHALSTAQATFTLCWKVIMRVSLSFRTPI